MKRKKSTVLAMSGPRWDAVTVTLFSIFLFFAMNLWTEPAAVGFVFIALVLVIGRTPWRLARERFCVPALGLLGCMLMTGLAAIYSPFGGSAVRDYRSILPAFALAALVLLRFEKRHVRGLLWGVAAVCGLLSLLSTDMACEGALFEGFNSLMAHFHAAGMYLELENTVGRVNGVYNDANITGSLFSLGTLISLYLAQTGEKWWQRLLACVLVSTSALGILLSVSRGAMLCFGVSLVVWLIAAGKGQRLRLFLLIVVGAGVSFAAFMPASGAVAPGAVLPQMLSIGAGVVIFAVDWAVGERVAGKLAGHVKWITVLGVGFAVAAVCFCIAALTLTGPKSFPTGAIIVRSLRLDAGEYTLSVDGDFVRDPYLRIYKTSDVEATMGRQVELYNGPMQEVTFTVPEDSNRVYFRISCREGDVLRSLRLSDGTEIPLNYILLPEVIAARLHRGIFTDNSFLLRMQFMKDGWALIRQAPVLGHGLGSSDNLYPTVQPFYYASRYVHNHVLQVLADQGLVGAIPFLVFLAGSLWLLIKRVRTEQDSLAAILIACWVMLNSHSLMEINFSVQAYACVAFVLLLLPVVLYGRPLRDGAVKMGGAAVCAAVWTYLAVFGGLLGLRQQVKRESALLRASSMEQLMDALDSYARRDVFDPDPYRLEYVHTALDDTEGLYSERQLQYVEKMRSSGNYPACAGLLNYYYLPVKDFPSLFACSRECLLQRTSYATVWNEQAAFYRDKVLPAAGEEKADMVVEGVLAFQALLSEVNGQEGRMEEIVLTEENQAFVDLAVSASASGLTGGALYQYLTSGEA